MNSLWVPKVAPSIESREAEIRTMSWEESQEWCNFVLMKPTVLPAGVSVETAEMRPESPPGRRDGPTDRRLPSWTLSNRACHRCVLAGKERRVRIKQYLQIRASKSLSAQSWLLWRMLDKQAYVIRPGLIGRLVAARPLRLRVEPFIMHSPMIK